MDQVESLLKNYRIAPDIGRRLWLCEQIVAAVEPYLRFFLLGRVRSESADDVLQEVLIAVSKSLGNFNGRSREEFWKWCYAIARHKVFDEYGKFKRDRFDSRSPEEVAELIDASNQVKPIAASEQHDLAYAMKLLAESKPECCDFLWQHYVLEMEHGEIAEAAGVSYDTARMRVARCLETAQSLVSHYDEIDSRRGIRPPKVG